MGHKALLRRGRNMKWLQYVVLILAAGSAGTIGYFALTMGV
jgi:hypothetical protein